MKKAVCILILASLLLGVGCTQQPADTPAATDAQAVTEAPSLTAARETESDTLPVEAAQTYRFDPLSFPRLDGSTSLVPLGEAVVSVLLGESREEARKRVDFQRTTESFRRLKSGEADLLLVSEPDPKVLEELKNNGFVCEMEQICTEALVFLVNENNPVNDLTTEQLRGIYTGEIKNWKEVGGNDEQIAAFQRNESAGSQVLMNKLVMQGTPMMETYEEFVLDDMFGLIAGMREYDNTANALGYSVYYYVHNMKKGEGLKMLSIDGVAPSEETIRSGAYPFRNPYYCVISAAAEEDSPARILCKWLLTRDGQRLIAREGYVPILNAD